MEMARSQKLSTTFNLPSSQATEIGVVQNLHIHRPVDTMAASSYSTASELELAIRSSVDEVDTVPPSPASTATPPGETLMRQASLQHGSTEEAMWDESSVGS